jgi:hypothetical protein
MATVEVPSLRCERKSSSLNEATSVSQDAGVTPVFCRIWDSPYRLANRKPREQQVHKYFTDIRQQLLSGVKAAMKVTIVLTEFSYQ